MFHRREVAFSTTVAPGVTARERGGDPAGSYHPTSPIGRGLNPRLDARLPGIVKTLGFCPWKPKLDTQATDFRHC